MWGKFTSQKREKRNNVMKSDRTVYGNSKERYEKKLYRDSKRL